MLRYRLRYGLRYGLRRDALSRALPGECRWRGRPPDPREAWVAGVPRSSHGARPTGARPTWTTAGTAPTSSPAGVRGGNWLLPGRRAWLGRLKLRTGLATVGTASTGAATALRPDRSGL